MTQMVDIEAHNCKFHKSASQIVFINFLDKIFYHLISFATLMLRYNVRDIMDDLTRSDNMNGGYGNT